MDIKTNSRGVYNKTKLVLLGIILYKKKKDGGFPSFNYGIKGYWEFMRGYMVNNHLLYYDKKIYMSRKK